MSEKIAILGAGPMGLAAAYQLALDGYKPILFEADDRIGGMTATFDFGGLEIERYYHFHCTSDDAFLQILSELEIEKKMRWVETKMGYWYQGEVHPWGNPIALLKFKGLSFTAKARYGLHAFLSTKRTNWRPLDKLEARKWIQRWIGHEAWDVLWKRLFDYKFHEYASGLSAAWIWSRIRRIGRSRYNLFREKLGYLDGGSSTLLNALKSSIETNGGQIRLKNRIEKVIITNNQVTGIQTSGQVELFDKVISTIPLPYVTDLMPDLPQEIINKFKAIKNIAVVCAIIKLRKPLTENFWLNTNDPDIDIPGLVEYTNLRPLDQHVIYVPFYMPSEHATYKQSDDFFVQKVKFYLKKINKRLTEKDFMDVFINRYRYAQPICDPGYLDKLPPAGLPVQGLWVADTSYYYPEDRGISESIKFGRSIAKSAAAKPLRS